MSIALLLLTLLFPPRPTPTFALPSTVAHLSPRQVSLALPVSGLPPATLPTPSYQVTATIYSARARQTDSTPHITADNSRITRRHTSKHRWIALSRDMLKRWGGQFDYGDSIRVSGISPKLDGTYVIHDTMNQRLHHTIDLLVGHDEAIYGKWEEVRISALAPTAPAWQAG